MEDTLLQRFLSVVVNPTTCMAAVRERPRWAAAALVTALCVGLFAAMTVQITKPEQIEMMKNTRFGKMMTEEQVDKMLASSENPGPGQRVLTGVQAGLSIIVTLFVMALVYLLFGKLAGGTASLAQMCGVVFWSSAVSIGLASLVKWPLVLARGSSLDVALGPAVLVADRGPTDALFQFLSLFDVFTIWGVILLVIGFEQVQGFARSKAASVVVATWLFVSLVLFGIGRLVV